jgi:hypothetical protein
LCLVTYLTNSLGYSSTFIVVIAGTWGKLFRVIMVLDFVWAIFVVSYAAVKLRLPLLSPLPAEESRHRSLVAMTGFVAVFYTPILVFISLNAILPCLRPSLWSAALTLTASVTHTGLGLGTVVVWRRSVFQHQTRRGEEGLSQKLGGSTTSMESSVMDSSVMIHASSTLVEEEDSWRSDSSSS